MFGMPNHDLQLKFYVPQSKTILLFEQWSLRHHDI